MECKEVQGKLPAYLERALEPREERLIGEHLSSCHPCARALLDMKGTVKALKGLDTVEPPPWMTPRVMSRVRAEEEKRKTLFRKLFFPLHIKIPIQAFATLLIAVLAVYLLKGMGPQMKSVRSPSAPDHTVMREEPPAPAPESRPPALKEKSTKPDKGEWARREKRNEFTFARKEKDAEREREVPQVGGAFRSPSVEETPEAIPPQKGKSVEGRSEQALPREQPPGPPAAKKEALSREEPAGVGRLDRSLSAEKEKAASASADQVRVALEVAEVKGALKEVEGLLTRLGASKVVKVSRPNQEVITAEIRNEKLQELIENLMPIGEVGVSNPSSGSQAEGVRIRIEIVTKN